MAYHHDCYITLFVVWCKDKDVMILGIVITNGYVCFGMDFAFCPRRPAEGRPRIALGLPRAIEARSARRPRYLSPYLIWTGVGDTIVAPLQGALRGRHAPVP